MRTSNSPQKSRLLHKPDYFFILILGIIVIFGIVMLSSAGTVVGYERFGDSNYYLKHHLINGILLGIIGFLIASKLDYHIWRKLSMPLLIITIFLLIIVFIPGLGIGLKGASRWINLGVITFQPAELAKLTFLFYLATWLQKRGEGVKSFLYGFLPFLILLSVISGLILAEPDFSTMLVLAFMSVMVFFIAGGNIIHVTWLGFVSAGLFMMLIRFAPYRAARFTVFLHPEIDPQGIGYHINQALLAIGSGGIFGLGLGRSRQKFNYLPEAAGDSIFAVIAEELGFIFCLILIVLFVALMMRGFQIARRAPDDFGKYVAVGIVTWITFQAFFNIAAMVGLVPLTGIPLPFISHGSTAVAISLVAMGVVVNISRQTKAQTASSRVK